MIMDMIFPRILPAMCFSEWRYFNKFFDSSIKSHII
jgi:hypothetical protein